MDSIREFLSLDANVSWLIMGLILFSAVLVRLSRTDWPEHFVAGGNGTSLLGISALGMILLAAAHNGVQLFVSYEMIVAGGTLLLFIGNTYPSLDAAEAALKFFLPGQVMAGLLFLAVSLPNGIGSPSTFRNRTWPKHRLAPSPPISWRAQRLPAPWRWFAFCKIILPSREPTRPSPSWPCSLYY
jgi:NADH:ubiquinone oxidoreductase subunit 2 (subunit N)